MTDKPPITDAFSLPRILVDETDGGDFAQVLRIATFAADNWTFGPSGPYENPAMTGAERTRLQLREGLLHLLELGLIDIDGERLGRLLKAGVPIQREAASQ